MLETIIANIKKAIRDREITEIGGGYFTAGELQALIDFYNKHSEA